MSSAVITYCGHFFHGNCLRKWLYVQETCPMCHQTVRPSLPDQNQASGDGPAVPPQRDTGPEPAAQEGDLNTDTDTPQETQSDDKTLGSTEQQLEERESFVDGDCGTEDKDQPAPGLRFSSSGDFVGFVSPVTSCSSGGLSSSQDLPGITLSNMHNQGKENGRHSLLPSTHHSVNERMVEGQDSKEAELKDSFTSCHRLPQNGDGKHDGTPKSWNSLNSPESSYADKNQEAVWHPVSFVESQTFVKSCDENSEHLDCTDDSQSCKGNGTCPDLDLDLDRLREAEPDPWLSSSDATFSCTSTDNHD